MFDAGDPPSWLWDPASQRIVSANRAALLFWDESSLFALAERTFAADEPFVHAARAVRDGDAPAALRLRFFGARVTSAFPCKLTPTPLAKDRMGVRFTVEPPDHAPSPGESASDRFVAALERLPYAVLLARADGTLVSVNAAAKPVGAPGALLASRLGEDAAAIVRDALALSGHVSRSISLPGADEVWHVEGRRLRDPIDGGALDVLVLRDLAGLRAAEAQLAAERHELATLVQATSDFLWKTGPDGRLSMISSGFERITGVPAAALLGRRWDDVSEVVETDAGAAEALRMGADRLQDLSARVRPPAAEPVDLLLSAHARRGADQSFQGYIGVGRRAPAAAVVTRGDTRAEALLDATGEALLALDGDGVVRLANAAAARLFGRTPERLTGAALTSLVPAAGLRRLAAAKGAIEIDVPGAKIRPVRARAEFRPLSGTGLVALVLIDTAQGHAADATLRRALDAAESANRQKSEFLAKVSHELRTPLNAIIGFAEIMRDERLGTLGNARYAGYVRDIHHSGQLLLSLINDLLDLSKIEAGRADLREEQVDVGSVVGRAVNLLKPAAANAGVTLATHVTADLPPVVADERSLEQIILNLVSNAVKFTEAGGRVTVSAEPDMRGGITLGVRDTGVGMSPAELKVALEPFRRVERSDGLERPGTGLGLPLAKALAEANSAEFRIASAPKAGTSIEIRFPRTRLATAS